MLSYNPHYFLRGGGEEKAVIIPALDAAETKVLTETGLMSFSFDNLYMIWTILRKFNRISSYLHEKLSSEI